MGTYLEFLREAEKELRAVDERAFAIDSTDSLDFTEKYVQHRILDGRNLTPYIVLEGNATNLTRMHCGNGAGAANISIVKKVIRGGNWRPILSDNSLNGMFRIPLRDMSRKLWSEKDVDYCGVYRQLGDQRAAINCGYCLACGLGGWMRTTDNKNSPHKVRAVSSVSPKGKIIKEYLNRPDPVKNTIAQAVEFPVPKSAEEITPKDVEQIQSLVEKEELTESAKEVLEKVLGVLRKPQKFASFYQMEFVAPGADFPIWVSFRDVGPAELGISLIAFSFSWMRLGIGRGKLGKLQFWDTNPEGWKLNVFQDIHKDPERYDDVSEVKEIITLARNCGEIAYTKKLFRRYEAPDIARVEIVETAKQVVQELKQQQRVKSKRRSKT